ncbi:hypothetical protein [Aquamicrobium terrae]
MIRGSFETIAEEMAHVLYRMSFSSIIRESERSRRGPVRRELQHAVRIRIDADAYRLDPRLSARHPGNAGGRRMV